MILFCHSVHDPGLNLALEETLAAESTEDIFMYWQNSPVVIIGRNQELTAEVDLVWTRERGIPVLRRMSGGGAVYHDLGTINFSYLTSLKQCKFEQLCAPVIRALSSSSLSPELAGNDLHLSGVKICGTAQCVIGRRRLFHGTMLYRTDLSVLARVLTPPSDKLRRHGVASVRARVGNLVDFLSSAPSTPDFIGMMIRETAACWENVQLREIPDDIWKNAGKLAETKYRIREGICSTMSL